MNQELNEEQLDSAQGGLLASSYLLASFRFWVPSYNFNLAISCW